MNTKLFHLAPNHHSNCVQILLWNHPMVKVEVIIMEEDMILPEVMKSAILVKTIGNM